MISKPLDFYLKWAATLSGLVLVITTSYDITPYNKIMGAITAVLWLGVGVLWREPSMWIINTVFALVYMSGLVF